MDRISKAIKKARQANPARPAHNSRVEPAVRGRTLEIKRIPVDPQVLRENRIIIDGVNDAHSHAYKVLRTRVWQQMRTRGWNTLGVTSANSGEGKSLTAINLAIGLSKMGVAQSIILVDLDMRRPSLHKYFGIWQEAGISDYLHGVVDFNEVLVTPEPCEITLLPGNMAISNSSEIISSSRMQRLLKEIAANFSSRIVLFDLPPMLQTDDVMAFAPNVDAMLFIIEEGKSSEDEITKAVELLRDVDVEILGTVLNKSEDVFQGEGYY